MNGLALAVSLQSASCRLSVYSTLFFIKKKTSLIESISVLCKYIHLNSVLVLSHRFNRDVRQSYIHSMRVLTLTLIFAFKLIEGGGRKATSSTDARVGIQRAGKTLAKLETRSCNSSAPEFEFHAVLYNFPASCPGQLGPCRGHLAHFVGKVRVHRSSAPCIYLAPPGMDCPQPQLHASRCVGPAQEVSCKFVVPKTEILTNPKNHNQIFVLKFITHTNTPHHKK